MAPIQRPVRMRFFGDNCTEVDSEEEVRDEFVSYR